MLKNLFLLSAVILGLTPSHFLFQIGSTWLRDKLLLVLQNGSINLVAMQIIRFTTSLATPPSIKGDTGIFELGISLSNADKENPLSVDFGVEAYLGVREGFSGSMQLKLEF